MSLLHRLIFGEGTEQTRTFSRESYPTYPAPTVERASPRPSASSSGSPALSPVDHEAEYRAVLARAFALIAAGPAADAQECRRVLAEEARLVDELGPRRADLIRAEAARAWHRETGRCPFCGQPGIFHESQHG